MLDRHWKTPKTMTGLIGTKEEIAAMMAASNLTYLMGYSINGMKQYGDKWAMLCMTDNAQDYANACVQYCEIFKQNLAEYASDLKAMGLNWVSDKARWENIGKELHGIRYVLFLDISNCSDEKIDIVVSQIYKFLLPFNNVTVCFAGSREQLSRYKLMAELDGIYQLAFAGNKVTYVEIDRDELLPAKKTDLRYYRDIFHSLNHYRGPLQDQHIWLKEDNEA